MDIVVGHEDEVVFDILEAKSKSHSHAEWAMIIVVQSGNEGWIIWDEAGWFHELVRCY